MLEVQKFYNHCQKKGDAPYEAGLGKFRSEMDALGIEIKDYPEHSMMLLNYSQINAIKNNTIVNECRGLLMGYDGQIIRKGFTRFYNLGENGVDTFDFENSIAFEKADGSLMFVYWCANTDKWEIGTRGTAFAEGPNEWHGTFRNFMLFAMGRSESQFQDDCISLNKWDTYLFEAVGPDNRIVTPYTTNHLIELGFVQKINGADWPCYDDGKPSYFKERLGWNVRKIRQYQFKTQESCMEALVALKGLEEGYVVYNTLTKQRVKIKNAVYLAAHRLRGNGLTVNAICELVALNEYDEYIAVFPEDATKFDDAIETLECMLTELSYYYTKHKDIESQKEFALAVKDLPLSGVMFNARRYNLDVIHAFNQFTTARKAEWIKENLDEHI